MDGWVIELLEHPKNTAAALRDIIKNKQLFPHLNLSHDSIIRLFRTEPGVLLLHPPRRRGVRRKTTMRIPESVVELVYRRFGGG